MLHRVARITTATVCLLASLYAIGRGRPTGISSIYRCIVKLQAAGSDRRSCRSADRATTTDPCRPGCDIARAGWRLLR